MSAKVNDSGLRSELLTTLEAKEMTLGPAISTTTFFRGDVAHATVQFKRRLIRVIEANPWLIGKLQKTKSGLELRFPGKPSVDPEGLLMDGYFNPSLVFGKQAKKTLSLNTDMNFCEVCVAVSGTAAEIPKGSSLVSKPYPLMALTLVADQKRPHDTFALVFSVSHVIVDGHTYYRLLQMLSCESGTKVQALNPVRKHEVVQAGNMAMGEKEAKLAHSTSLIMNVVSTMLCSWTKPKIQSFEIDLSRVEKDKERAEAAAGATGVDFVSTNDILTSSFGRAVKARALLMPVNWRDRLPGFSSDDAGNYEGALLFGPDDYAEATSIRSTLKSGPPVYKRGAGSTDVKPLPGACEALRMRIGMVTSWCFGCFDEVRIENCSQLLHMPHCDVSMVPFDAAVVYRAKKDQLRVACFVRGCDQKRLQEVCPFGKAGGTVEDACRI